MVNKSEERFENYTLLSETFREVFEHEVFLSFLNDNEAIAFHDWLVLEGMILFKKWLDKNYHNY